MKEGADPKALLPRIQVIDDNIWQLSQAASDFSEPKLVWLTQRVRAK
jgi:hypothetical protein